MKKNTQTLICLNIFYAMCSWHFLLNKLIKDLIKNKALAINSFSLYLSHDRGDHLQIILESTNEYEFLKLNLTEAVESFLITNPSERTITRSNVQSFFMDYYNNTFWFEKYEAESTMKKKLHPIDAQISKTLINALTTEEIDNELILTFALYMQISLIKAVFGTLENCKEKLAEIIYNIDINISEYKVWELKDNKEPTGLSSSLIEIVNDIWQDQFYDESTEWLKDWIEYFKLHFSNHSFDRSFMSITQKIYLHLGLEVTNKYIHLIYKEILTSFIRTKITYN